MNDLCLHHCVITPEVDSDSATSSERRPESLLQDDGEDPEPESAPTEETEAGPPFLPLRRSTRQRLPPDCHLCNLVIGVSVAREIMHAAAQSVHKYVWHVK